MPFAERVILYKGVLLDPDVKIRKWNKKKEVWVAEKPSSATSYCWLVWIKDHNGLPQMVRIEPSRKRLTKVGDYPPLPDDKKPRKTNNPPDYGEAEGCLTSPDMGPNLTKTPPTRSQS